MKEVIITLSICLGLMGLVAIIQYYHTEGVMAMGVAWLLAWLTATGERT